MRRTQISHHQAYWWRHLDCDWFTVYDVTTHAIPPVSVILIIQWKTLADDVINEHAGSIGYIRHRTVGKICDRNYPSCWLIDWLANWLFLYVLLICGNIDKYSSTIGQSLRQHQHWLVRYCKPAYKLYIHENQEATIMKTRSMVSFLSNKIRVVRKWSNHLELS